MFYKARIKLTLWYVLMIMTISLIFSIAIYQLQLRELKLLEVRQKTRIYRELESHNMVPFVLEISFIDEAQNTLILNLFYLNGLIFVLSGIVAWLLSGKTLNPIHTMMTEQSRFISDASHELKTPLTSLKTAFEVFGRSKKKTLKEADTIIRESIDEVNRLQKLTDALLQLAQTQKSLSTQLFEELSLTKLLKDSIKKVKPLALKRDITVTLSGSDLMVEVIASEIHNLFLILLENAVKYSPKKSAVAVSIEKSRNDAIIKIQDRGIGIADNDLPYIFDRFYRADSARTYGESSGYGLGLSIAQHIIKKHNGSINVDSKIDKGSTFIIHIPIKHTVS